MTRRFTLLALAGLLTLSACAGARTFDQDLRALQGHPVNDAAIKFGQGHTGEYRQGDATVYVWKSSQRKSIFGDAVTKGRGYQLGGTAADGSGVYWTGIQHNQCVIRATTTDGIIRKITSEGNPGGCETIYGYRRQELGYDSSQRP